MALNTENQPPVIKRPNWYLICTGGLLTTGGLGWCLKVAYAQQPKAAMVSYLAGTTGVCLMNFAVTRRSGKNASTMLSSSWLMLITGGMLAGCGFGYCLKYAIGENPKTAAIAYSLGTLGYVIVNSVLYTFFENNEKKTESRHLKLTNKEMADLVNSANARLHYMGSGNQCEYCKAHVEKEIRERKEAEKRSKEMNAKGGFLRNIGKICLHMVSGKDQDFPRRKTSSRVGLKREKSKSCQDNVQKELSNRRETEKCLYKSKDIPTTALRRMDLSRDPEPLSYYRNLTGHRGPMTMPNKSPDEKSTQTESQLRITSTQTEDSLDEENKPDDGEDQTTDNQSEDEGALVEEHVWSTSPDLEKESHRQKLTEVPTKDQQLKLEDEQLISLF